MKLGTRSPAWALASTSRVSGSITCSSAEEMVGHDVTSWPRVSNVTVAQSAPVWSDSTAALSGLLGPAFSYESVPHGSWVQAVVRVRGCLWARTPKTLG